MIARQHLPSESIANKLAVHLPTCLREFYRQLVAKTHTDGMVDVDSHVARVVARLNEQVTKISSAISTALEDRIPELPRDDRMIELLHLAVKDHLQTILHALLHDIGVEKIAAPVTAIEYAKGLAEHSVPANALVRAHRLGQRQFTELMFAELHAFDLEPKTRVAVIETITTVLLKYVDSVELQAVAAYQGERKLMLDNQNSLREMQVRDVLEDGRSVDVDAASVTIGYPLRWQHLALIVWYPGSETVGDELARLQQFIRDLATAAGTSASPLLATADTTSEWAWLPYRAAPGDIVMKIRDFVRARPDAPNIAIGAMGSGVEGFRRSHRQAQRARAAAVARSRHNGVLVAATDPGIIAPAMLAASVEEVREWVADVLGPLASDTGDDARLRKTLREFLHTGSGYKTAAEELNKNRHAVKYNVERAVARRGRPLDDRLDVELALLTCQWYGAAVLQPA
jgi:DNA-binding PucR family transcriptional regulator